MPWKKSPKGEHGDFEIGFFQIHSYYLVDLEKQSQSFFFDSPFFFASYSGTPQRKEEKVVDMPEKVKGTVKWFSNRKGFGFVTPTSDNAPTKEDIFVHQSSIITSPETYRTLKDGFLVEFEVITDSNGKLKADNVTSSDGSPCPGPEPRERRRRRKKSSSEETGEETPGGDTSGEKSDEVKNGGGKDKKGGKSRGKSNGKKTGGADSWYTELDDSVKEKLESLGIKIDGGKAFVAQGDARIKLGTAGYAAFVHASGLIAEGTFSVEKNGKFLATWAKVLKYDGSDWKLSSSEEEKDILVTDLSLLDDTIQATTGGDATTKPVWGDEKGDPREALEANEFQIRSVVFHHTAGRRRRGRGRRKNTKNSKSGEQTTA